MSFHLTITRKKIKNLYLRVHPDGTVAVSAPKYMSDKDICDFVNSKDDWIEKQLKKLEERKQQTTEPEQTKAASYVTGEIHYLWGKPCVLLVEETVGRSSVEVAETNLRMYTPVGSTKEQRKHLLTEFYRQQLKQVIPVLLTQYVFVVGKTPKEWRIRNMKTRWGTCNTREGRIWLSLNLAKKHPDCLAYVIAHELTHLHVPNHSKAFWARMDVYYPRWREVRKLLNE